MSIMVSINCITYNHEKYIADAIESFLMQKTDFDFEILIGEDCSLDGTRKIVEDYVVKYPNKIRMITSNMNVGARKNARKLHENSKGKYVAICEGDDYWTNPLKLQKQVNYFEDNPNCTLCFHSAEIVRANKGKTGRIIRSYNTSTICQTEDIIIGGGGFCPTQSLMYVKKLMDNPPELLMSSPVGDYPLQMLVSSYGYAYYMDEIMSAYRTEVKDSWTKTTNVKSKSLIAYEGLISLLDDFDIYSKSKFSKEIDKAKLNIKCQMLLLQGNIKELKSQSYRAYYDELGAKEKIKLYARHYLPKAYTKLANVRARIKAIIYNI